MGGVFGHMSHIYDNPGMTFGQIKDIMTKASAGQLENVTEKTDGQNLFVSYNVQDGTVRAARNKGNLKAGGMNAAELAEKFGGRGALTDAFVNAFKAFEIAVDQFSDEEKLELFGPNTNIFYNAEVMDPANANVINYDTKTFLIHRAGHAEFDRETGKPIDSEKGFSEKKAATLQAALEKAQEHMEGTDFKVQVNAIRQLEALGDDIALARAEAGLDRVMSSAGVSDDDTIADYIIKQWRQLIENELPDLNEDGQQLIIKRVMNDYYGALEGAGPLKSRGLETRQIVKSIDQPELNERVVKLIKSYPQHFKKFIFPIESVIHRFAIEILRAVQSAYIIAAGGNEKEVGRLQALVGKAIDTIQASGNEEAMEIIKAQLEKLSQIEDDGSIGDVDLSMISSAAEGIVFDYDGHTYKFTGGFAPANQILGLFKYGRKGIPAMADDADLNEEIFAFLTEQEGKYVVLIPGGFKPPHKGHYAMLNHYAENPNVQDVVVLNGPKAREGVTQEMSQQLFDLYGGLDPKIQFVEHSLPMRAAFELLGDEKFVSQFGDNVTFVLGCSQKVSDKGPSDAARATQFAQWFQTNPDKNPLNVKVGVLSPCPVESAGGVDLSASVMRKAAREGNDELLSLHLPKDVDVNAVKSILPSALEEVGMAGGAVAGFAGRVPAVVGSEKEKKPHKKNFLPKKEEMVNEVMDYLLGISVG
tara:strand:+ start:2455 stop:4557 length:2103 start_codon:yes stop_codon:yes gene_type:complete